MDALSPTQIESLLADRLKRHEDRLREHRAALEGQKAWLHRGSGNNHSNTGNNNDQSEHAAALKSHHADDRYTSGFHPSQVLPMGSSFGGSDHNQHQSAADASSQHQQQRNTQSSNSEHGGLPQQSQSQQQQQQHVEAGALSNRNGSAGNNISNAGAAGMSTTATTARRGGSRQPRRSASSRSQSKEGTATTAMTSSTSAPPPKSSATSSATNDRAAILAAALEQRSNRAAQTMLKYGPETGDAFGVDILSGNSIMDVAAAEQTAACTFKPAISADSRVLAKKLRAACGAQGKDVVESMEAIHQRAMHQKWLRMQEIHDNETRPYAAARQQGGKRQQQNQRHRTPPATTSSMRTPRGGGAGAGATPQQHHSNSNHHQQHDASTSGSATPAHLRLHTQATKHVREERLRQLVADATQENTFSPAITSRARQLRRHPGHNVGGDLYDLAQLKSSRDALVAQMRDEMDVATAKQMGRPMIDSVSASIANSLAESSFERLTKRPSARTASAASSSNASNSSSMHHHHSDQLQPTFHPEINRRSEILAHTTALHSPTAVQLRREERLQQLRHEVEQQRMEDCTFKPQINPHPSHHQDQHHHSHQDQQSRDFHSRNEAWLKRRDSHLQHLRQEKEKTELAECVFAPAQTSLANFHQHQQQNQQQQQQHHQQQTIYGGADRRAWGFDQHLDRMHAARIIEQDRQERADAGVPFTHDRGAGQHQQDPKKQQQTVRRPTYSDPTDAELRVFAAGESRVNGALRDSVLDRAQEALARATAVTADQQRQLSVGSGW